MKNFLLVAVLATSIVHAGDKYMVLVDTPTNTIQYTGEFTKTETGFKAPLVQMDKVDMMAHNVELRVDCKTKYYELVKMTQYDETMISSGLVINGNPLQPFVTLACKK